MSSRRQHHRLDAIEERAGRQVVAYTGARIDAMNALSDGKRYDARLGPRTGGEPDPTLVYVPEQHGHPGLGWTTRGALTARIEVDRAIILDPDGIDYR